MTGILGRRRAASLSAALFIAASAVAPALAGPARDTAPMPMGSSIAPPRAQLDFCLRAPEECGVDPAAPDARRKVSALYWSSVFGRDLARAAHDAAPVGFQPVSMTSRSSVRAAWDEPTRRLVDEINRGVNRAILNRSDISRYGVADYWSRPTLLGTDIYGDCEDYALEKRRRLIAAGIPAEALMLALGHSASIRDHAVLVLSTDRGDMVLDSLTPWVVPWRRAPYAWVQRQVPGRPFEWVRVGRTTLAEAALASPSRFAGGVSRVAQPPASR